ncbi:hypothetical protein HDU85_001856 [Gaertneriomyces sp. JEL0708]|nr:hypothetical protein HDU85_001856 [Gaertneriomyces sp. JEL0708]
MVQPQQPGNEEAQSQVPSSEKAELYHLLDRAASANWFTDLHTHLLGMGSADFWVSRIMVTYLPRVKKKWDVRERMDTKALNKFFKELIHAQLELNNEENAAVNKWVNTFTGVLKKDTDLEQFNVLDIMEFPKSTWDGLVKLKDSEKTKMLECFGKYYTDDVVYTQKELLDAVHPPPSYNNEPQKLQFLESAFSKPPRLRRRPFKEIFRQYLIFSARGKNGVAQFKLVTGITNSDLLELMELGENGAQDNMRSAQAKANEVLIRNGFSMLNPDGTQPKSLHAAQLREFRGCFTPEFYPRRFALKDCIYSQRLEVLGILLNNTAGRYGKSGVIYVEYSVGINDMLNLNVWKHLVESVFSTPTKGSGGKPKKKQSGTPKEKSKKDSDELALCSDFKHLKPGWRQHLGAYVDRKRGFTYRFLAAFNRTKVHGPKKQATAPGTERQWTTEGIITDPDKGLEFLMDCPEKARSIYASTQDLNKMFAHLFEASENEKGPGLRLRELVNTNVDDIDLGNDYTSFKNEGRQIRLLKRWFEFVVGLDWVGDETGFPYCAFVHPEFLGIFRRMHEITERTFGARIHGGESVPRPASICPDERMAAAYKAHMHIVCDGIIRTHEGLKGLYPDDWCFLRIGHGVAFLNTPENDPALQEKYDEILIKAKNIVLELNMTSNAHLLTDSNHHETESSSDVGLTVAKFISRKHRVVLSTDDDGVWPIRKCKPHYHHVTVPGEFCTAIAERALTHKEDVKRVIERSFAAAFTKLQLPKVADL